MNVESKYRRKLKDLVSKIEAFIDETPVTELAELMNRNSAFMPLMEEAMIIKRQLENEEQYHSQIPGHGVTQ